MDARVRYLSLDWIDLLTAEVAASTELAELAADHELGVTQVVTGGPEGLVLYHLHVGGGVASFGAGPADVEHLRFEQDWETAVGVATGALDAQECFITGKIKLFGDPETLVASRPVFAALDAIFGRVRERTDYV